MANLDILLHRVEQDNAHSLQECLLLYPWTKEDLWSAWDRLQEQSGLKENRLVLIEHILDKKAFIVTDMMKWIPQLCTRANQTHDFSELRTVLDRAEQTDNLNDLMRVHIVELTFRHLQSNALKTQVVCHPLSFNQPPPFTSKEMMVYVASHQTHPTGDTQQAWEHAKTHVQPHHLITMLSRLSVSFYLQVDQMNETANAWLNMVKDFPLSWWQEVDQLWEQVEESKRATITSLLPQWEALLNKIMIEQHILLPDRSQPTRKM